MQGPQLAAFANLEPTGAALVMICCLAFALPSAIPPCIPSMHHACFCICSCGALCELLANSFVSLPTKLNIHLTAGSLRYPVRSVPYVQVPLVTLNWLFWQGLRAQGAVNNAFLVITRSQKVTSGGYIVSGGLNDEQADPNNSSKSSKWNV